MKRSSNQIKTMIGIFMISMLTACDVDAKTLVSVSSAGISQSEFISEKTSNSSESQTELSSSSESTIEVTEVDNKSLYDHYLDGEIKTSLEPLKKCNQILAETKWPSDELSLGELCSFLKDNTFKYGDGSKALTLMYSYIDCGHDGVEELVVRIESGLYDWQPYIIYKDNAGKLEMTEVVSSYSRDEYDINEFGYVTGFGSGGAGTHYYSTGILDSMAHYSEISSSEYSQNFYGEVEPGWGKRFVKLYQYITKDRLEGDTFEAIKTVIVPTGETIYSFSIWHFSDQKGDEEVNDPELYINSVYAKDYKKAGIEYISKTELVTKIENCVEPDVLAGKNIEWIPVGQIDGE